TFSIQSGPGTLSPTSCTTTSGTGSCTVTLTSNTAGTTVINASTTVTVGGVVLTRTTDGMNGNSGPATKVSVANFKECTLCFWKNHEHFWNDPNDPISQNVFAAVTALHNTLDPNFTFNATLGLTDQLFRNIVGVTAAQMTAVGLPADLTLDQAINT